MPFKQILLNLNINKDHKKIHNIFSSSSIKNLNKITPYKNVLKSAENVAKIGNKNDPCKIWKASKNTIQID